MALSPKNYSISGPTAPLAPGQVSGIAGSGQINKATDLQEQAYKDRFYLESDTAEIRREQIEAERQQQRERLRRQITGEDTKAAEQAQLASSRGLAQQLATLQAQRGGSPAAAARQFARGAAEGSQQAAQDVQISQIGQRQQARDTLAAETGIDQDQFNQATQNYIAQGFEVEKARQAAAADMDRLNLNVEQQMQAYQQQLAQQRQAAEEARKARKRSLFGGILGAAASIGGALIMSDQTAKKKIKKASSGEVAAALQEAGAKFSSPLTKKASNKYKSKKIVSKITGK